MEASGEKGKKENGKEVLKKLEVDIYIASESRMPSKIDRWMGFSIQTEVLGSSGAQIREKTSARPVYGTVQCATIITIIEALDRFIRPAQITVHIEESSVINSVKRFPGKEMSDLETWQSHGWKTARGTEVKNRAEWQRLYNKLRVFEHAGGTFEFVELDPEKKDRVLQVIDSIKKQED